MNHLSKSIAAIGGGAGMCDVSYRETHSLSSIDHQDETEYSADGQPLMASHPRQQRNMKNTSTETVTNEGSPKLKGSPSVDPELKSALVLQRDPVLEHNEGCCA